MIIKNVMEMTWREIHELDKEKTVLFATIAPIEEHSFHLPLGTDIYEGEHWRENLVEALSKRLLDYNLLLLPSLPIGSAGATGFYGNIHFKQSTLYLVVSELLENLASWGMKNIVLIASHADPIHLIAIEEACEKVNQNYGVCAISPMGSLFSAKELGMETPLPEPLPEVLQEYSNDFHAGWVETSMMLEINSSLVKETYDLLPDTQISEQDMVSPKKVLDCMGTYGHLGYPRLARKEWGSMLIQSSVQGLTEATIAFVKRKGYQRFEHHVLYNIPFLRTHNGK